MSEKILICKRLAEPGDPRRESFGRRLAAGSTATRPPAPIPAAERFQQRGQRTGPLGRTTRAVDGRRGQSSRRARDDEVQRAQLADGLGPLSASTADGRSAAEEERHIAAQLGGRGGQFRVRKAQFPTQIGGDQGGRGVAGPAAQSRGSRNPLHQPQTCPEIATRATAKQIDRPHGQILRTAGDGIEPSAFGPTHRRGPLARKRQLSAWVLLEVQGVVQIYRAHEGFDLMIPVSALRQHLEEQVQLRRRLDDNLHRRPVDFHR